MSFDWPESLFLLRNYLRSAGSDVTAFKTSRQAAFVAQQLLGTRIKFPEDCYLPMVPIMLEIQKAVGKSPAQTIQDRENVNYKDRRGRQKRSPGSGSIAGGINIFCDGASSPNPGAGGWGVVVYNDGDEIDSACGGDAHTTNNQMELVGLLNAIVKASSISERVTIWCDSQYCVKGANVWRHGWKAKGWKRKGEQAAEMKRTVANLDLWMAVDEALEVAPHIRILWVKGHAGTTGNERADQLASMGRAKAIEEATDDLTEQYTHAIGGKVTA